MPVPVDDAAGNDPLSFPALRGVAPAGLALRVLARAADAATAFCWWALATSGTPGAVAAGALFVLATALMLGRAQTPGEALVGLVALDVETGQPAPGAAFVKVLLQLVLVVATLGLGLVALLWTTRGPLRRNLADRATGVVVVSLRADSADDLGDSAGEGEATGWVSAVGRARWEGPALELPTDASGRAVQAQLQVTESGIKVRAGTERVLIRSEGGTETWLTPGDGAVAPPGSTIMCGGVDLTVAQARERAREAG